MKKVFIVHGFEGSPNGGWRPWLMGELAREEIYACALAMPSPEAPRCDEWVEEIARAVERALKAGDEVCLVGHSLGVPAILRFLEEWGGEKIKKAVLVSGPCEDVGNTKLESFLKAEFKYDLIKSRCEKFTIIHGDNDPLVPLSHAEKLSGELAAPLKIVPNGGHLNGSSGWLKLPEVLEALTTHL